MVGKIDTYTDTMEWIEAVRGTYLIIVNHMSLREIGLDIMGILAWVEANSGGRVRYFDADDPVLPNQVFEFDSFTDYASFKLRWADHVKDGW